ncbi:LysR substrate-binding domain-containing protein [Sporolactobacillus pectinivorans]|uniref:LysR substrate-binding domain-containing protein n=1 Tax=Sporolactobacillus pectinivorans TaxID=1591408 RepID=UPI000C264691|nr:LysR substrate-binding domain-containing protein [Sporolactobacillus pectinivorans]
MRYPRRTFVSIGGSAARGEADLYSDIDLMIYTDSNKQNRDRNAKFKDGMIQLHFAQIPLIEQVHRSPWAYRFAATKIPDIISSFQNKFPNVKINVEVADTESLINQVIDFTLHGAFVDGPVAHSQIVNEFSFDEEIGFVSGLRATLDAVKLVRQRFFMLNPNCIGLKVNRFMLKRGIGPVRILIRGSLEAILDSVRRENGIAVLPRSFYEKTNHEGLHFIQIPDENGRVQAVFIRRKDAYMTKSIAALIRELHYPTMKRSEFE